jgi:Flp pilus assembly pilin Flp
MHYIKGLLQDKSGQDLTEYALLAGFISITSVATLRLIGPLVAALWDVIHTAVAGV